MKKLVLLLILFVFVVLTACDNTVEPSVILQTVEPSATQNPDLEMTVSINPDLPDVTLRLTDYVEDGEDSGYRTLVICDTDDNEMNRFAIDEFSDMTKPYSYGLRGITLVDVDFNGYMDIEIYRGGSGRYDMMQYFVWRDGSYQKDPYGFADMGNLDFDSERQVVKEFRSYGIAGGRAAEHIYFDGELRMVYCEDTQIFAYNQDWQNEQIAVLLPELAEIHGWALNAHSIFTYDETRNVLTFSGEFRVMETDITYDAFSNAGKELAEILDWEWMSDYWLSQFSESIDTINPALAFTEWNMSIHPDIPEFTVRCVDWMSYLDQPMYVIDEFIPILIFDKNGNEVGRWENEISSTTGANSFDHMELVDVNFDGYLDIRLYVRDMAAGMFNDYLVWQNGRFVNDPYGLNRLVRIWFDEDSKLVVNTLKASNSDWCHISYRYINDVLTEVGQDKSDTVTYSDWVEKTDELYNLVPELSGLSYWWLIAQSKYEGKVLTEAYYEISTTEADFDPVDAESDLGLAITEVMNWTWEPLDTSYYSNR